MRKTLLVGLLCLAGCETPPLPGPVAAVAPKTYHDVAYYDMNTVERDQTTAWCRNNTGVADQVPDCRNASSSRLHEVTHKLGLE